MLQGPKPLMTTGLQHQRKCVAFHVNVECYGREYPENFRNVGLLIPILLSKKNVLT